ncbi:MAG: ParB N-terminal domain-containing protein [Candidatus Bathyarchaeia archaeon]
MEPQQKIDCAYDQLMDITELEKRVNKKNPNTHPESQIELLCKIIAYQGCRSPIVLSRRSGLIVKGHARLAAMKSLGWAKAPVDWQDYDNEEQEIADMVADNELQKMSLLDFDILQKHTLADFNLHNEEITQFLALPQNVINFLLEQNETTTETQNPIYSTEPITTTDKDDTITPTETAPVTDAQKDFFTYRAITVIFTDPELYEKTKQLKTQVESKHGPEAPGHALLHGLEELSQ